MLADGNPHLFISSLAPFRAAWIGLNRTTPATMHSDRMRETNKNVVSRFFLPLAFIVVFILLLVSLILTALLFHSVTSSRSQSGQSSEYRIHEILQQLDLLRSQVEKLSVSPDFLFPNQTTVSKLQKNEEREDPREINIYSRQKRTPESLEHNGDYIHTPGSSGGTTYTRWGRINCSETSSTTIVYSGVIAVTDHVHNGGGCNHLCMPFDPEYGYQKLGKQIGDVVGGSRLKGVEYRAETMYPFDNRNNFGRTIHNEDAVCSVCYVPTRSVSLMIPAKRSCPPNWVLEYTGYLMTNRFDKGRTDYLCVDDSPQGKPSGENTVGGSFLQPVEGDCGALPCPKYGDGLEIACVVCTK